LTCYRSIDTRIALVCQNLDAPFGLRRLGTVVDEVAPRIGKPDIANVLHAIALHAISNDLDQKRGGLRNGDAPLIGRVRLPGHRGNCNHRNLKLGGDRHHGYGRRSGGCADQQVDLFFLDELACVAGRGRRIGAVVELNQANLLAVDFAFVLDGRGDATRVWNADRGAVSAERRHESDRDISLRGRGRDEAGDQCGQT